MQEWIDTKLGKFNTQNSFIESFAILAEKTLKELLKSSSIKEEYFPY